MAVVRYIKVTLVTNMFKPATRAFGDIAIVGATDNDAIGPMKTPIPITNPDSVTFSAKTTLSATATVGATTVDVTSRLGFPSNAPFQIRIGNETMAVTGVSGNTLTVTRGADGTTASAHANGDQVIYTSKEKKVNDVDWFKGPLGTSVRKCFAQKPGPTTVYAVRTDPGDGANALSNALAEVGKLSVQIVALSNTSLVSNTQGKAEITSLSEHVNTVSNTVGDGKERIGVAMLVKDAPAFDPNVLTGISNERMVMVAHKSDEDAAAAVAGTIAGYEPHISLLLKPVNLDMEGLFSDGEIEAFDTARVNWLTDPTLIPGKGLFMGEGYTLDADIPYIDIIRTIDDISFRLKAQLIRSIGDLRVSRSGLRTLVSQMTAVLEPLKQREVIEGYDVFLPLLVLLDKDPLTLTDPELQQINNAQNDRTVDAIVAVDYAGAIHRLNITLKFE